MQYWWSTQQPKETKVPGSNPEQRSEQDTPHFKAVVVEEVVIDAVVKIVLVVDIISSSMKGFMGKSISLM